MSVCPPLNIQDDSSDPEEHTATCPYCGGECTHPFRRLTEDDYQSAEEDWVCFDCDYYYEGD